MIVDDGLFRLIGEMIVHDSFSVSSFVQGGLDATFFRLNWMAAERDSKEIVSSGEEESRNLDEYLYVSEAEKDKMNNKRKSKKTSSRKRFCNK